MSKLRLNLEQINEIHNDKINCHYGDIEEKQKIEKKMELFENHNNKISNKCDVLSNPVNTNGSSGTIYNSDSENEYVKFSDLPLETSKLFNKKDINCSVLEMKIDKSINENLNSIKYAELNQIFPFNIMEVYDATQCKNNYGMFSNIITIEKINGITLSDFLASLDFNKTEDTKQLICCVIQLIYIITYANLHGYVHNDLTTSNILVYFQPMPFELNGLVIDDSDIKIKFNNEYLNDLIPTVKIIDFSYSTWINPDLLNNKIIFGETIQAIKMIINKLQILKKNCILLNTLHKLINQCLINTELAEYFVEMDIDISSFNGYRLFTDDKIISLAPNNSITHCLKYFFHNMSQIINQEFMGNFEIIQKNIYYKQRQNQKMDQIYYKKYIKYKNKYLVLKKFHK